MGRQDPRNGRERRQPHPPRQEGRHSSIEHLRRMTNIGPKRTAFFLRTSEKKGNPFWPPTILFKLSFSASLMNCSILSKSKNLQRKKKSLFFRNENIDLIPFPFLPFFF